MASIRKVPGRRSKPWRVEIRRKGADPISETFRTKREASDFAAKVEADFERWSRLLGGELKRHTVAELLDRFIGQWAGKDTSVVTRAGWWRDQYGGRLLSEFTADTVREGLARLEAGTAKQGGNVVTRTERRRSPATINRYRTAISTVYKAAIDGGWFGIGTNPTAGIRHRKEKNNRFGRCLEDEERVLLLEACDGSDWAGLGLFVRLALATGARRGELLKLEWPDVDLQRGTLLFRDTKNAEDRRVPLIGEARVRLAEWGKVRRLDSPRVFPHPRDPDKAANVDWFWNQAKAAAGVENLRIHDLRHSCGSYLARAGASAFQIAAILGHRSGPTLTARYVHLVAEDSRELLESSLGGMLE
ncbi:MAG: site-specific integrase [Pseudomonadota bacterium]|nr:site-specific integrase [Pseudomonadota bacterium]